MGNDVDQGFMISPELRQRLLYVAGISGHGPSHTLKPE
jgi:hypothetical protein